MKVEAIEVRIADGTTVVVKPDRIIGDYAVHHALFNARPYSTRWSVTHIPTGQKVWMVLTLEDAERVAQYLDETKVIPADPVEARAWCQVPAHYGPLRKELERIATYFPFPL